MQSLEWNGAVEAFLTCHFGTGPSIELKYTLTIVPHTKVDLGYRLLLDKKSSKLGKI